MPAKRCVFYHYYSWGCSLCLSLDGDFHVRTRFEAYFRTLFIRQGVFDAYFSIQMIPAFNGYLRFFWLAWKWGLYDLLNRPRQDGTGFFAHWLSQSGVTATLRVAGNLVRRRNSDERGRDPSFSSAWLLDRRRFACRVEEQITRCRHSVRHPNSLRSHEFTGNRGIRND